MSDWRYEGVIFKKTDDPLKGFEYGGVIVSNCDLNIDSYKPADKRVYPGGNNHGSIVEINGKWYIFYHRQTNGTWFSRQGCMEQIEIAQNGTMKQVEMTSMGGNGKPLEGRGEYHAYIAGALFYVQGRGKRKPGFVYPGVEGLFDNVQRPRIRKNAA